MEHHAAGAIGVPGISSRRLAGRGASRSPSQVDGRTTLLARSPNRSTACRWMCARAPSLTLSVTSSRSRSLASILRALPAEVLKEVVKWTPVLTTHQHDREICDLPRLNQRERLEQLVERPEPARHGDERVGVLHEHQLADEEVAKVMRYRDRDWALCSFGSRMLQPIERPPASRAPRLAASMRPGPPPVMTVKPRPARLRPTSRATRSTGAFRRSARNRTP